jgi:hypothetical protein
MGEVIRFVPMSERERAHLIRAARAMYNSIFPPVDPMIEQRDTAATGHKGGTLAFRSDEVLS